MAKVVQLGRKADIVAVDLAVAVVRGVECALNSGTEETTVMMILTWLHRLGLCNFNPATDAEELLTRALEIGELRLQQQHGSGEELYWINTHPVHMSATPYERALLELVATVSRAIASLMPETREGVLSWYVYALNYTTVNHDWIDHAFMESCEQDKRWSRRKEAVLMAAVDLLRTNMKIDTTMPAAASK